MFNKKCTECKFYEEEIHKSINPNYCDTIIGYCRIQKHEECDTCKMNSGNNYAITAQGEKEISLNRDILAREIWCAENTLRMAYSENHIIVQWKVSPYREKYLKIADEIIKHESELFEAREG